ncbi:MAG: hypothetical protein J1G06_09920 [Oscillospiraceae bacterium]|nr:hypothetical protein [Oscillospiraceae bacterium]
MVVKKTGINGIVQAALDNMNAETERLAAIADYFSMMTGVDIPTEEDTEHE